ncbi:hypothetical protein P7C73_g3243, partial [Tremellales sp. Uapishka_1]
MDKTQIDPALLQYETATTDIPIDPALFAIEQVVNDVRQGRIRLDEEAPSPGEAPDEPHHQQHHHHDIAHEHEGIQLDDHEIDPALREIVNSLTNAQQSSHITSTLSHAQAADALHAHLTDETEREHLQQSLQTTLDDLSHASFGYDSLFAPQSPLASTSFDTTLDTKRRGRGRPKGSKNKPKPGEPFPPPSPEPAPKRRKGRPPKKRSPEEQAELDRRKAEKEAGITKQKGRPRKYPGFLVREMRLKKNRGSSEMAARFRALQEGRLDPEDGAGRDGEADQDGYAEWQVGDQSLLDVVGELEDPEGGEAGDGQGEEPSARALGLGRGDEGMRGVFGLEESGRRVHPASFSSHLLFLSSPSRLSHRPHFTILPLSQVDPACLLSPLPPPAQVALLGHIMLLPVALSLLSFLGLSSAAPLSSRQADNSTSSSNASSNSSSTGGASAADLTVVKFATLAESLEASFYQAALTKYGPQDFQQAGFVDGQLVFDQLTVIMSDEQTHLKTLQAVAQSFGSSTSDVDSCQFNFDTALASVSSFLATARVLEYVGIDAYVGGTTLIDDKSLLVSAAEIVTVEARHNTILNTFNSTSTSCLRHGTRSKLTAVHSPEGSAIANAFDMVLTPQQVLSVAAPFISGDCDPATALGLTPTPALTITNSGTVTAGTLLSFAGSGLDDANTSTQVGDLYLSLPHLLLTLTEPVLQHGRRRSQPGARLPDELLHGAFRNRRCCQTPLSANIVNQDETLIVAGPIVTFIDTIANLESEVRRFDKTGLRIDRSDQLLLGQDSNVSANSSSNSNSQTIIITEKIVEEIVTSKGIKNRVYGGQGGAIPLGWLPQPV